MFGIPKVSKISPPNGKERLVVYVSPRLKSALEQRAKSSGVSSTKFVEDLLKRTLSTF